MEQKIKSKRCAVYTRKSVEDGLEQEFNSLDAQREAAESFILSQKSNGWVCLPNRYDDGGYSGGNTNRPALKQLLADCEAGKVDVIVVYKIDRLSRSLCDFADLSKLLDKYGVSFVSVTQEINTSTSSGRMMLNILMTFAQYEREIISERIRDKMRASRRRGQWTGGRVPYGYRSEARHIYVIPEEAEVVKRIFRRYTETQSPKLIALELNKEGILNKVGKGWNMNGIRHILANHIYIGEIHSNGEFYEGEHEAIIDMDLWNMAQEYYRSSTTQTDNARREETMLPLRGILRCGHCGCAMTPTYTDKKQKRYYYYKCQSASKNPLSGCPIQEVPAGEIEKLVFEQLISMLRGPDIVATLARGAEMDSREVLAMFDGGFWSEMKTAERARLMELLLEKAELHSDNIVLELRTAGVKSIIEEAYNANSQED